MKIPANTSYEEDNFSLFRPNYGALFGNCFFFSNIAGCFLFGSPLSGRLLFGGLLFGGMPYGSLLQASFARVYRLLGGLSGRSCLIIGDADTLLLSGP